MSKIKSGQVFPTNEGGSCTVISYQNSSCVNIKFNDSYGHLAVVRADALRRGKVKNPYYPRICGVGFIGVGNFDRSIDGKITKEFSVWVEMIRRCYWIGSSEKDPAYKNCTVHKDWHNFQNFAEWITAQEHFESGYELDKDLLVKGNDVYSESTCCLVPAKINLLIHTSQKKNSDLPTGVSNLPNGRFRAYMIKYGRQCFLGSYDTPERASEVYVSHKESYVKKIASLCKDEIAPEVFDALLKWTVY